MYSSGSSILPICFFVPLTGASASFWVTKLNFDLPLREKIHILQWRVIKSAAYLLLPFISWTLFSYHYGEKSEGWAIYLRNVIQNTDLSLWFFAVHFPVCRLLINWSRHTPHSLCGHWREICISNFIYSTEAKLLFILVVWIGIRTKIPEFFGSGMTNFLHGGLFFFFLSGIFVQLNMKYFAKIVYLIPSFIIFIALVPFWSRVGLHSLTNDVPTFLNQSYIGAIFTVTVAFFGSLSLSSNKYAWK